MTSHYSGSGEGLVSMETVVHILHLYVRVKLGIVYLTHGVNLSAVHLAV